LLDLTPSFRNYARYRARRLGAQSSVAAQDRVLRHIIRRARKTQFGRDHGFGTIRSIDDFQRQVPIRGYEAFWREYWQDAFPTLRNCTWPGLIPYFALTSGTITGGTKFIPHTREMSAASFGGMRDLLVHHVTNRPASCVLGGKGLMLGGTSDLKEMAPGVYAGDLSGIAANAVPWWLRARIVPPRDIALIADWSTKIEALAPLSLDQDIRILGGTPNWLLLYFDELAKLRPNDEHRLASWYPKLELIVHGGVNFAPYRKRFGELLEGSGAETREAYSASEAFIAAADRGDGEGLRLVADRGVFFEFVPTGELQSTNPARHWLGNLEPDVEYAVIVSTCAGVWAYQLGDTVRFIDRDPPRLLVTGRTAYLLSAFGEHLIDEEIEEAVSTAANAFDAFVIDYTVSPINPARGESRGGHHYVIECDPYPHGATEAETFARMLDKQLCELNDDYRTQRRNDFGLRPPQVQFVPSGTFAAWMKYRKKLGGQHKVPRIINDRSLFEDLQAFVASPHDRRSLN